MKIDDFKKEYFVIVKFKTEYNLKKVIIIIFFWIICFQFLKLIERAIYFLNTDNPNKLLLFLLNNTQMSVTSKLSEVFDIYKRTLLKHEKTLNYFFLLAIISYLMMS